jgi:uncharacterized membrane protein
MVLELQAPEAHDLAGLAPLWPAILSYVLSFVHVGIYRNLTLMRQEPVCVPRVSRRCRS